MRILARQGFVRIYKVFGVAVVKRHRPLRPASGHEYLLKWLDGQCRAANRGEKHQELEDAAHKERASEKRGALAIDVQGAVEIAKPDKVLLHEKPEPEKDSDEAEVAHAGET